MKNIIKLKIATAFCLLISSAFSQNFTWMKGTNQPSDLGVYGTMGLTSSADYPIAKFVGHTWTDNNNNLWLFGGSSCGTNVPVNELWKYDIGTNQWTWMKGSKNCIASNQIGVYGTINVPAINNTPGGRVGATTWKDASGNLWLYGGAGFGSSTTFGRLSDLWKYNVTTNMWTWVAGPTTIDDPPVYGTKGQAAALNTPGAVAEGMSWADGAGNFWLYGGALVSMNNANGVLWKYNLTAGQWTWVNGDTSKHKPPVYGVKAISAPTNWPGTRIASLSWTDNSGKLWLFGGHAVATNNLLCPANDLWKYDPVIDEWVWISGNSPTHNNNYVANYPNYCVQGISSPAAMPGARYHAIAFKDTSNNLWLFGGIGFIGPVGQSTIVASNDLWRYNISSNQWKWVKGKIALFPLGTYGTQTVPAPANIPGGREGGMGWTDQSGNFWIYGGAAPFSGNQFGYANDLWKYEKPCSDPFVTTATPACSLCPGQPQTLIASGATSYSWSNGATTNSTTVSPNATTVYTLTSTGQGTCTSQLVFTLSVLPGQCVDIGSGNNSETRFSIFPNPNSGSFRINLDESLENATLLITSVSGEVLMEQKIQPGENHINTALADGLYFIYFMKDEQKVSAVKVVIE